MDIDHKRLSVGIFRCVPFYKVYRSDPHPPGVSGTFMLFLLCLFAAIRGFRTFSF